MLSTRLAALAAWAAVAAGTVIAGPAHAQALSAGQVHACLLNAVGRMQCWGANSDAQLGDGTTTQRLTSVDSTVVTDPIKVVAAGAFHTCYVTQAGAAKCFGSNSTGQLGNGQNGTTLVSLTPVDVQGLGSGVVSIDAGRFHTCALLDTGGMKCWGGNFRGQLGNNSTTDTNVPVDVQGLTSGVASMSVGERMTCAVTTGGGAKCWGINLSGQVGVGNFTAQFNTPQDVSGLATGVAGIEAGDLHACAVMQSGAAKCWGLNVGGELGDGTRTIRNAPVDVVGLTTGVRAISLRSGPLSCALLHAGGVKCWGDNPTGQVGNATTEPQLTPVDVDGLSFGVESIATHNGGACALTAAGAVKCWGSLSTAGNGFVPQRALPTDVPGVSGVQQASTGGNSCHVTTGGAARCVGFNRSGGVGDGTGLLRLSYTNVLGLSSGVQSLASMPGGQACAVVNGGLKCWGSNTYGAIGDGTTTDRLAPVDVTGLTTGVASVVGGIFHSCALTTTGGVKCWGRNFDGENGTGTTALSYTPVDAVGLASGMSGLAAGGYHSCVITPGGGVKCWGYNANGQVGNGNRTSPQPTPVDVVGLAGPVQQLALAVETSCALLVSGGVQCWGRNFTGQLGDGSGVEDSVTPVTVAGLSNVQAIASGGGDQLCALTAAGGIKCWGGNFSGEIGDGTLVDARTPVDVAGLASGVASVAPGGSVTCAVMTGGALKCWGAKGTGKLGTGELSSTTIPVSTILRASAGVVAGGDTLATPGDADDLTGSAVAASDNVFVVGASAAGGGAGAVYVFERGATSTAQVSKALAGLVIAKGPLWAKGSAPVATLTSGGAIGGKWGSSVAVAEDGATILVGAPDAGATGTAYAFERPVSGWADDSSADASITPPDVSGIVPDGFGGSVAMDGNKWVVGAPSTDVSGATDAGAAYAFDYESGAPIVVGSPLTAGAATSAGAGFGSSVDIDGGAIVAGAPDADTGGVVDSGAAYFFASATDPATPLAGNGALGDKFGASVAIAGGTAVVGAPGQDTTAGTDSGAVLVFEPGSAGSTPVSTLLPAPGDTQAAGTAIALNGQFIVVGAPLASLDGRDAQGAAYVYEVAESTWKPSTLPLASIGSAANGEDDRFGSAVAASSRSILVGVPGSDGRDLDGGAITDEGRADAYEFDRILRAGFE